MTGVAIGTGDAYSTRNTWSRSYNI